MFQRLFFAGTLSVCAAVLFVSNGLFLHGQEPSAKVEKKSEPTPKAGWAKASEPAADHWSSSGRLTIREARRKGITALSAARAYRELLNDKNKPITVQDSEAVKIVAVGRKLFESNRADWGDEKAIDWDSIFAFLEAIWPIIERLIDLFTAAKFSPVPSVLSVDYGDCLYA